MPNSGQNTTEVLQTNTVFYPSSSFFFSLLVTFVLLDEICSALSQPETVKVDTLPKLHFSSGMKISFSLF